MPLSQLFLKYKHKTLTHEDYKLIINKMKEHDLQSCTLWSKSPLTRIITATAKLQGYLVIIAGALFIPPVLYEKYQEDPSKALRLYIYAPIALAFVLAPLILHKRNARKILDSISYRSLQNKIELQTYTNKLIILEPTSLRVAYNPKKPNIIHKIISGEGKEQKEYLIEGYGEWDSVELFKYLVTPPSVSSQIL